MNMKKLFFLFLLSSCNLVFGDKELGRGYSVWNDGKLNSIVYSDSHDSKVEVIPYNLVRVYYNNRYILAVTDSFINERYFWLIDKEKKINMDDCHDQKSCDSLKRSNVIGPLDSLSFENIIGAKVLSWNLKVIMNFRKQLRK